MNDDHYLRADREHYAQVKTKADGVCGTDFQNNKENDAYMVFHYQEGTPCLCNCN